MRLNCVSYQDSDKCEYQLNCTEFMISDSRPAIIFLLTHILIKAWLKHDILSRWFKIDKCVEWDIEQKQLQPTV